MARCLSHTCKNKWLTGGLYGFVKERIIPLMKYFYDILLGKLVLG
jgi:hypothetical protein